jgi:hypothetical protein
MQPQPLEAYDYVNHPYERVCRALVAGPKHVLRQATGAAAVDDAMLHVRVVGVEIGVEIAIDVVRIEQDVKSRTLLIGLSWRAAHHPAAFPVMVATLRAYPLTPTETQLALEGNYVPPLGGVGAVFDAAFGHRVAEAAITQLVRQVGAWLRENLVEAGTLPAASASSSR